MNEDIKQDKELDPKRRSHDRQYWDDRLKRYVDFETPAEVLHPSSAGPTRYDRRRAAALVRSPVKRRKARRAGR